MSFSPFLQQWAVVGYDEAREVLRSPSFGVAGQMDLLLDARPYSQLSESTKAFLLKRLADLAAPEQMAGLAELLPIQVIAELIGVPEERWNWVRETSTTLREVVDPFVVLDPSAIDVLCDDVAAYYGGLADQRKAQPADDLISVLVKAGADGEIDRIELVSLVVSLLLAGHETTTGATGNAVVALSRRSRSRSVTASTTASGHPLPASNCTPRSLPSSPCSTTTRLTTSNGRHRLHSEVPTVRPTRILQLMDDDANDRGDDNADDAMPNPFAGLPMFGDLSKALSGQGPLNWDAARQFALLSASGGDVGGMLGGSAPRSTPNIDPSVRIKYGELAAIARLHVADVMELPVTDDAPEVATPEQWAAQTLDAYRPLFDQLAESLGQVSDGPDTDNDTDPMAQMMAGLTKMMGPAMMGMSVGSMVGGLARRAFGVYDLPIPRATPALVVVPPNIDAFAEAWEVPLDEMRLWVISHELAGNTVLSIPHISDHLRGLVQRHVGAFHPDASALSDKLVGLDTDQSDPMAAMQAAFGDPEVLLGAVRSDEQLALEPELDAAVAMTIGVIDWVVDAVAVRVIGGDALQIAEAVRRRRAEKAPDDTFVERLLGIRLGPEQTARGKAFVQGVVDRAGERGLAPLFSDAAAIPTPNEIEAPGLWLARVDPDSDA